MKNFLILVIILLSLFCLTSCKSQKSYIENKYIEKIEYRDSIIKITDTIKVNIPVEKYIKVIPKIDTSYLETKVAKSISYYDTLNNNIYHSLENKNILKTKVDTFFKTQNIIQYKDKEIIKEVEVEKPYIPTFAWICICYCVLSIGLMIFKIWNKIKLF